MPTSSSARIHSLDNLKWFIVWLMVIFHAAMCYMAYAPEWWYVVDNSQPLFPATVFICWVDIFIMPVMFFISGYFGIMSLSKKGTASFWKSKLTRIVLPWIFGAMMIAPFIAYIMLASRNSDTGFLEFYTTLFWGPYYQQAHYWYLGALTALYILLNTLYLFWPELGERQLPSRPHRYSIFGLFLFFALSIGTISSFMHPDTWTFYGYVLVLQPVRFPSYIAVFMLGAWAWRKRWFTQDGYCPALMPWLMAFLSASIVYLWQKLWLPAYGLPQYAVVSINALCQSILMLSALFSLLGFFHEKFNASSSLTQIFSSTSYGVYYLHQGILFPIVWLFTLLPMSAYLKYVIVSALTLGLCIFLCRKLLFRCRSFT